jgi:type IV secretion system protein VirD4
MKRKTIVAVIVCIAAVFINVYFSTIVHELMNKSFGGVTTLSLTHCIASIKANQNHFIVFISLQLFVMLGVALLLLNRYGDFISNMIKVTEDIKIPVPAGQKQHGSARWLTKKEQYKTFDIAQISKNNPFVKELIDHGYDDLKFMKKKVGEKSE